MEGRAPSGNLDEGITRTEARPRERNMAKLSRTPLVGYEVEAAPKDDSEGGELTTTQRVEGVGDSKPLGLAVATACIPESGLSPACGGCWCR